MKNFELVRTEEVKELNTEAKIYRHIPTGAEILSMENDDENKCFGIAFRTPPSDSTGITPAFFKRVERVILLVTGESKRGVINTLLNSPESIPAGIALADHPAVELWTDITL